MPETVLYCGVVCCEHGDTGMETFPCVEQVLTIEFTMKICETRT